MKYKCLCGKQFINNAGLGKHKKHCDGIIGTKRDIQKQKREKYICPKCNYEIKTCRQKHFNYCTGSGPRRLIVRKKGGAGWAKGLTLDVMYGLEKSKLIKKNISNSLKGKSTGIGSTPEKEIERRNKIRISINKRYENGWMPKAGRCKKIKYISPIAGEILVDGTWELKVAIYFDTLKVNWCRNKKRFLYYFNNKNRYYTPDFYMIDEDIYIEVKGYKTDMDIAKWKQFPYKINIYNKQKLKELKIL